MNKITLDTARRTQRRRQALESPMESWGLLSLTTFATAVTFIMAYTALISQALFFHVLPDYIALGTPQIAALGTSCIFILGVTLSAISLFIIFLAIGSLILKRKPAWGSILRTHLNKSNLTLGAIGIAVSSALYGTINALTLSTTWLKFDVAVIGIIVTYLSIIYFAIFEKNVLGRYSTLLSYVYTWILRLCAVIVTVSAVCVYTINGLRTEAYHAVVEQSAPEEYRGYMVVWTATDIMILADLDNAKHCFGRHYVTLKLEGEHSAIRWHEENTGALQHCMV